VKNVDYNANILLRPLLDFPHCTILKKEKILAKIKT